MHLSKIKKLSIALGLTLLPVSVLAAGLGQLKVTSGIGEPLKAEIELLSVSAAEKASLKANIAPESTYRAQGLDRPASHQNIKVQVAKSNSGKNILKLRSNQPMTEPFLDMLVEVEWETGRILREYTVLLDPPGYNREVAATQVETPVIKASDNKQKKSIAPLKKKSTSSTSAASSNTTSTISSEDHLTQKGDTLSKIAHRMKPEGVSLDQMLVGLFEANPDAFSGNNMNRLKVGKILQKPSEEALNAIGRKQAAKEIKVQTANWNEYRNNLAGIVSASTPQASEEASQSSSGKIKPATEDQSAADNTGPKDVVKLSSGDAKAAEADMQAKITALQEEVSAREKGLKEAQDRTAALEKQIEDMQKLLTLKNNALSEAQQAGEKGVSAEKENAEETVVAAVDEAKTAEPAAPVQLGTKIDEKVESSPAEAEKAAAPTPAEATKPVPQPKPAEAPVEQPSFISGILDTVSGIFGNLNTTIIGAIAGLLALLIGAWFYLRNKRRKNLADFEQGIMTSGGLKANTVFGNTSGASVDTGDTSFLTDFSQSTSGGMIDTNDVDPIAEAEVYMAYGRDAQAEEILKDAISKEPKRYELHLKLLEMYAASKDMSAFETVSGELYTTLGAEDPTWAKVAEIGIKLEPNNPLYQIKEGAGPATTENADEKADSTDEKLDASDFSDSPLAAEADLDFSLNDDAKEEEQPNEEVSTLEDAATVTDEETQADSIDEAVLDIPNVSEVLETNDESLEFDLNLSDTPAVEEQAAAESSVEESFANTMPNLDFPTSDTADTPKEEVELSADSSATVDVAEAPTLEMPSDLTLDMPTSDAAEEVSLESSVEEGEPEAFGFDVDTLTGDTVTLDDIEDKPASENVEEASNILDMSDISLDVNDDVNEAISEATPEPAGAEPAEADSNESEEVETKLELVAAYIDMEDKEGAKELLDEVLKEGGANQRKRAEEILATLG